MSDFSIMGSYSGIGMDDINKLMEAHKIPLVQMSQKKGLIQEKQNAWKEVNTKLNTLYEKMNVLKDPKTFNSKTAISTDDKMVSMTTNTNAILGEYKVSVKQLATNTQIIGKDITDSLGVNKEGERDIYSPMDLEGSFEIVNADGEKLTIKVEKDHSLKDIVNKINDGMTEETPDKKPKSIGIKATIINNRLVISDEKTGERDIKINALGDVSDDNVASRLGIFGISSSEGIESGARKEIGKKAQFNINGIDIEKDTNSVKDVVEGVTIHLNKEHEDGRYDTITVGNDQKKVEEAIEDFIDQYNSTMGFIESKMDPGDPEVPGSRGPLAGDSSIMGLQENLRRMVTDKVTSDDNFIKDISELGVKTIDKQGLLTLDANKLGEKLKEDPNKVQQFFHKDEGNGYVYKINKQIDAFISKRNGIIKDKNESFDRALRNLNKDIENFNRRMELKEKQYIKKFTALDTMMMKAEEQMSWLQGQVSAMNNVKK